MGPHFPSYISTELKMVHFIVLFVIFQIGQCNFWIGYTHVHPFYICTELKNEIIISVRDPIKPLSLSYVFSFDTSYMFSKSFHIGNSYQPNGGEYFSLGNCCYFLNWALKHIKLLFASPFSMLTLYLSWYGIFHAR